MKSQPKGYPYREGNKWKVRYRLPVLGEDGQPVRDENGKVKRIQPSAVLADVAPADMRLKRPPACVQNLADEFMRKLDMRNLKVPTVVDKKDIGFKDFVETVYFVNKTGAESSMHNNKQRWFQFVEPMAKAMRLRDFDTPRAQQFLRDVAKTPLLKPQAGKDNSVQAKSTVHGVRVLLSGVFKSAIQDGYYSGANPMRETDLKSMKVRAKVKGKAYSLDEELVMIKALKNPARVLVACDAFSGLRRGELFGLDWTKYINNGSSFVIDQVRWEGALKDTTKNEASTGVVPVVPLLKKYLDEYRAECGNPTMGPIFANMVGTGAFLPRNIERTIRQVLNVCVCGAAKDKHEGHLIKKLKRQKPIQHPYKRNQVLPQWHGWHGFRYGLATNLKALGVDTEIIKQILRHANSAITSQIYIKEVTPLQVEAMSKLGKVVEERLEKSA
jgi:integrase